MPQASTSKVHESMAAKRSERKADAPSSETSCMQNLPSELQNPVGAEVQTLLAQRLKLPFTLPQPTTLTCLCDT